MAIAVEILTVAHMHGVTTNVSVGKTLDSSGRVAIKTQTGVVLDTQMGKFASVSDPAAFVDDSTMAVCHAAALKLVQSKLGGSYTLNSAALTMSGMHVFVPGERWVEIKPDEGLSYAFQLQVQSTLGPVDQKSVFYVNGEVLSVDILVVVQTP
jgi:small basic protein